MRNDYDESVTGHDVDPQLNFYKTLRVKQLDLPTSVASIRQGGPTTARLLGD